MRIDHYGEVHADISSLIEREHLMDVLGTGLPPEKYNFGGMSGGPMLTVVEHKGIRGWRLAGVIYDGPNPSADPAQWIDGLEIIKARRADFILPDGTLDKSRYELMRAPRRNLIAELHKRLVLGSDRDASRAPALQG